MGGTEPASQPGQPKSPQSSPFDMYRLAVEMADRVSARRATANSFFLTIHAGLAAFVGVVSPPRESVMGPDRFGLTLTAVVGLVLAGSWWLLLRSYRDLNSAKFKVITEVEQQFDVRPFAREWEFLKTDPVKRWRPRYAELGFVERVVPLVFAGVYIVLALRLWL